MILRHISESIRRQDWFTVFIEVLIVVIGVFLGIEVANWNTERQSRADEDRLVSQLLLDVRAAIDSKQQWIAQAEANRSSLVDALHAIHSDSDPSALSDLQCRALWSSHIIVIRAASLTTLDELLATGALGKLQDARLRRALLEAKASYADFDNAYASMQASVRHLSVEHAAAFPRTFLADEPDDNLAISTRVDCQLDVIRADQTLINKIISNLALMVAHINVARAELRSSRGIEDLLVSVP